MDRLRRLAGHIDPCATAGPGAAAGSGGGGERAMPLLTAEQLEAYERDGFIVVKRCVPLADIKRYHDRFVDVRSRACVRACVSTACVPPCASRAHASA